MKYNVTAFVKGFLKGTLGNKKIHSGYRVLEGEHCKLLVRAERERGRPIGNTLVAMDLSTSTTKLVFTNGNPFKYAAARDIGVSNYQMLPTSAIGRNNNNNLLASGVVDESNSHALIEIGDVPFLFSYSMLNGAVDGSPIMTEGGCPKVFEVMPIPNRVSTIKDAIELIKIPNEQNIIVDAWAATIMPEEFQPPKLEKEYEEILSTPLDPLKVGYTLIECRAMEGKLVPMESPTANVPMTNRQLAWNEATSKWSNAATKFNNMHPAEYKGLNTKKSRYGYGIDCERVGTIIVSPSGVFVKGKVYGENRDKVNELIRWHRLENQIVKYRL